MSKARDLADFVSDGNPLADGTISVSEVSGAAPTASPTFTGTVTASALTVAASTSLVKLEDTDTNAYAQIATDGSGIVNIAADEGSTGASPRITFDVSTTERMRIDSNGRVGIGVTSMNDATLEIQPATDIPQIKLTQNNVPDGGDGWKFHNSGPTGGNLAIIREGSGVDTEYFRLGTSGQIGLSGANYGTSGQVLKSNGSGAAPSWGEGGASTGKAIAMAIVFG